MNDLPYPQNHPHYIQGVYAERERIIALLEESEMSGSRAAEYFIALIKGENE